MASDESPPRKSLQLSCQVILFLVVLTAGAMIAWFGYETWPPSTSVTAAAPSGAGDDLLGRQAWQIAAKYVLVLLGGTALLRVVYRGLLFLFRPRRTPIVARIDRARHKRISARQYPKPPLFAVAMLTDRMEVAEPGRDLTVLVPFGIARHIALLGLFVGGLIDVALFGTRADHTVYLYMPSVIGFCLVLACIPTFIVVHHPANKPLDDHFRGVARSERPSFVEGVSLNLARDTRLGAWWPSLFVSAQRTLCLDVTAFVHGLWLGFAAHSMRPQRLRTLVEANGQSVSRYLHRHGMSNSIVGTSRSTTRWARNFAGLYFGHVMMTYGLLLVAIITVVVAARSGALGSKPQAPIQVLIMALLGWWGYVIHFAVNICGEEMRLIREDFLAPPAIVPRSSEAQAETMAAMAMLRIAEQEWIPTALSVASTILLIAALTMIQALGSAP